VRTDSSAYDRRVVWSWATYDFANSSFTTLIVTFIYATFFTGVIAENDIEGTRQWSLAVTVTAILVALLSPYVGAIADRGGYRKRFLGVTTAICVAGSVALFFPMPGEIWFALVTFTLANVAFEMANVFYNAFLPDITPPSRIGRVSGYGWGLGYLGGLLCLFVALVLFVQPEVPAFGLSKETYAHVRATNVLVAVWYALFAIPLFLFVPEKKRPPLPREGSVLGAATRQFAQTFREIRQYRQVFWLLIARLLYNDGLITIFAFGGIYAQGTFGFTTEDVIIFGIALNVAAGLGALAFGVIDDRIGGKRTIMISLVGLLGATVLATFAPNATWFWVAAVLVGLLIGPNQSASRSLLGRFIPPAKENEFYGFFAFSGKATAFLGPFLFGVLTDVFGTQRAGVAAVAAFFVLGAVLLLRVDEQEGVAVAQRPPEAILSEAE
jgi:UMF1 family MFS transporter